MVSQRRRPDGSVGDNSQNETHFESSADQALRSELETEVWEALAAVHDPEIPPCSITDLGIVSKVRATDSAVEVDLLPTFAGCPALDVIREDTEHAAQALPGDR